MPPALFAHLSSLTPAQRGRMARESRDAIRIAWPNRRHFMNRDRIRANVLMLRRIASV